MVDAKKKIDELLNEGRITDEQLLAAIDYIKNPPINHRPVKHYWGTRKVKIGLLSDTHIGSLYSNYDVLKDVFKRFKAEGVEAVYHAGDITEGYNRRKGHSLECELHGADAQVKGVVERIPSIGVPIYFITGDHDQWHWQNAGTDVGDAISRQRDDMHYLGPFQRTVELSKNTSIMLMHPAKGTAYAISYHPQKMAEALSGGEKPNILAIGHYHKIEYLFYRNIHIFQTGTTQNQTPWMKRMNLSAHLGAWIIELTMKRNGTIDTLTQKLLAYY